MDPAPSPIDPPHAVTVQAADLPPTCQVDITEWLIRNM